MWSRKDLGRIGEDAAVRVLRRRGYRILARNVRCPMHAAVGAGLDLQEGEHMPELVCELIISLDGFARGQRSPAYYGYFGPDFADWIKTNTAVPHRMLIGRRTYELLEGLPAEVRDDNWKTMTTTPGWLFSRTLEATDWPGLRVVRDDAVGFVRELKRTNGPELRTLGSLSVVRQLLEAGLVDRLKLVVCPLILPQTGIEPTFEGLPDMGFDLLSTRALDGRVLLLEYRPTGAPPYSDWSQIAGCRLLVAASQRRAVYWLRLGAC